MGRDNRTKMPQSVKGFSILKHPDLERYYTGYSFDRTKFTNVFLSLEEALEHQRIILLWKKCIIKLPRKKVKPNAPLYIYDNTAF